MRNRIAFIIGFVFSVFFSISTYNFVNRLIPTAMIKMALQIPELEAKPILAVTYSKADVRCLQENIFFEARNQQALGMAMVGIVTIQRSHLPEFPKSICGVVYQPSQFSWTAHSHVVNFKSKTERVAWEASGVMAQRLLSNVDGLDELYKDVAYYHKITIHPKWADSMRHEFVVQDHVFYSKVNDESPRLVLR